MQTGITVTAPSCVAARFDEHGDIRVTWNIPEDDSKIIGYEIMYEGDDGSRGTRKIGIAQNGEDDEDREDVGHLYQLSKCVNYMVGVRSESIYTHSEYTNTTIKACNGKCSYCNSLNN